MVQKLADMNAEGILLAGAGRAILLQLADPGVGHGVAEHSTFTDRPINRLKGTLTYVYAVTYGTEEQIREVRRRVNRAHVPVRRGADQSSAGYNAYDPELQLWVTATLYDTALTVIEKIYGPLDNETADAMYQDYARLGTALQLPPGKWPKDREEFNRYYDARMAGLRVSDAAVRVGRGLLYPQRAALWYRAVMPFARFLTAGLLPDRLRQAFGLPWSGRDERRFHRTMKIFSLTYPRLPQGIRHWFKNYCLSQLETSPPRPVAA